MREKGSRAAVVVSDVYPFLPVWGVVCVFSCPKRVQTVAPIRPRSARAAAGVDEFECAKQVAIDVSHVVIGERGFDGFHGSIVSWLRLCERKNRPALLTMVGEWGGAVFLRILGIIP